MRPLLACSLLLVPRLGQDDALEHARKANPEHANMPNFVADEITKRYTRRPSGREPEENFRPKELKLTFKVGSARVLARHSLP
jgi:hypothetical protein